MRFTYHSMVRVAFIKTRNISCIAAIYGCSRTLIRHVQAALSWAAINVQTLIMRWILHKLRARPPDFSGRSVLHDETGERLVFNIVKGAKNNRSSSTWQVLIFRRRYIWGWIKEDDNGKPHCVTMCYDAITTPIPLLSTSAKDQYYGLHHHKLTKPFDDFDKELDTLSGESFSFRESDNATSNDRYTSFMSSPENTTATYNSNKGLCFNHGDSLNQGQLTNAAGIAPDGTTCYTILNDLYAMSLFLTTGGHFLRLIIIVHHLFAELVHVLEDPPQEAAAQNAECKDMLLNMFTACGDKSEKAVASFSNAIDTLFSVINGGVRSQWRQHYSKFPIDKDKLAKDGAWAFTMVFLRSAPSPPAVGKWTKLYPCVAFFSHATLWGFLQELARRAFTQIQINLEACSPAYSPSARVNVIKTLI